MTYNTSIFIHLGKVECSIKTARKLRDINIEGELLVYEVEGLVLGRASRSHEVEAGADVRLGRLGDKLKRKRVSARRNAVCACQNVLERSKKKQTHLKNVPE